MAERRAGEEAIFDGWIQDIRIPTSCNVVVDSIDTTYFTICFSYRLMTHKQEVLRTHNQFRELHNDLLDTIEGSEIYHLPPLPLSLTGTHADQVNLELYLSMLVSTTMRLLAFTRIIFFLDDTLQNKNSLAPLYINDLVRMLTSQASVATTEKMITDAGVETLSTSPQKLIAPTITTKTAYQRYNDENEDEYSPYRSKSVSDVSISACSDESTISRKKNMHELLLSAMNDMDDASYDSINAAAQKIIAMIQPHREQLAFRAGVVLLLAKQVRLSLGVTVIEEGPHAIMCFLPDHPISLAVVLWKGDMPNWHLKLGEQLSLLASNPEISNTSTIDDDSSLDIIFPSEWKRTSSANVKYDVTNVSYPPATIHGESSNDMRVLCTANSIPVELYVGARCDMYMSYLLEYIADLVGKDNLFKRSLLLIKAWWLYETSSYIGCVIKHYLSDMEISLMICTIFNIFHLKLQHPIQALAYFLIEYSQINWETSIITLNGIVNIDAEYIKNYSLIPLVSIENTLSREDNLLPADFQSRILDEYYSVAPVPNAGTDNCAASSVSGSKYGESEDLDSISFASTIASVSTNTSNSKTLPKPKPMSFQLGSINILNPFSMENMASLKPNKKLAARISKAIVIGAKHFLPVITSASGGDAANAMDIFYRRTLSRFGSGWRPDVWRNMVHINSFNLLAPSIWEQPTSSWGLLGSDERGKVVKSSREKIYCDISYYNFIVTGVITNVSAIHQLVKQILFDKGPLPVGEIGKSLQELSSTASLSAIIKETFGGLKKVLEGLPDDFFIFTDHPFNPHVFLRKFLETEELAILSRGVIPSSFIGRLKKKYSTKKTNKAVPSVKCEESVTQRNKGGGWLGLGFRG